MTVIVAVGSNNPAKLDAVRQAFVAVFPRAEVRLHGLNVESGVPEQPWGDTQIREGARRRASQAMGTFHEDYAVGLESGVEIIDDMLYDFSWIAVVRKEEVSFARSVAFPLPDIIRAHLKIGVDLSEAMRRTYGIHDAGKHHGAIGHFTDGLIPRSQQLAPAVMCALIPFLHPKEFFPRG